MFDQEGQRQESGSGDAAAVGGFFGESGALPDGKDFEAIEGSRLTDQNEPPSMRPTSFELAASTAQAHERLLGIEHRARLATLLHLAEVEDADVAAYDGAGSVVDWLTSRHGVTGFTAREMVRVAAAIRELPALVAAFACARISWDQLRAVTRFATADTDALLVRGIIGMSPADIRAMGEPAPSEEGERAAQSVRSLQWYHDVARPVMHFHAELPEADGSALLTALKRAADQRKLDPETGDPMLNDTAMADALVAMGSKFLGADVDADRATVLVTTDVDTLLALRGGTARLGDGRRVTNATLRRLACDARIQLALEDPERGAIGVGRTTRTIPGWMRRVITSRDGGCRFPRCHRRRWVHVHHIVHWADGGPTDVDNLITLCGFHHRLLHSAGWAISGDPQGDVEFIRPDGSAYSYSDDHIPGVEFLWLLRGDPEPAIAAGVEVNPDWLASIRAGP
jgi:hypothetical protein